MKKLINILLFALFLMAKNSYANQKEWNMKFAVTDPNKAFEFCKEVLGMKKVETFEKFSDTPYKLKFRDSKLEFHFVKLSNNDPKYLEMLDKMTLNNTFLKKHAAIIVNDLDYYLEKFVKYKVPFLGPARADNGMYQIYFEIPDHAYLELNSMKRPELLEIISWRDIHLDTQIITKPEVFEQHYSQ